ncbi:MAG TPA: isoprenyl transferase [Bacteroidales bacterium]|nr:isoprenyl transferase [Bacteroidales bacterium]
MSLINSINRERLPKHVAIIMDGNGRWAMQKGKPRIFGHQSGTNAVRTTIEAAAEIGIEYLTLYAFSTENWKRPKMEVEALMALLITSINDELDNLVKNKIKLNIIGDTGQLPISVQKKISAALNATKSCSKMTLTIALSYSGRWEILEAVKKLIKNNPLLDIETLTEAKFSKYLSTHNLPDPELLIRTSGEYRLSNFLLWQLAYAELYFTKALWPDFSKEEFFGAIIDFQGRERRFGKTSEQLG